MCIYNHFNLTHKWWAKRHSACVTHPFDCHQIHWKPEFVEQFACKWDQQTTCALKNTQKSQRRSLNSFYSKFTKIGSILGVELSEIWVINNLLVLNAVKNTLKKSKHNSIGYNVRESYTIDRIIWFELQNIVLSHSAILFHRSSSSFAISRCSTLCLILIVNILGEFMTIIHGINSISGFAHWFTHRHNTYSSY